jgi:hypothetical protein
MGELDSRYGALLFYEAGDRYKRLGMCVAPDPAVIGADAPFRAYRASLNHNQTRSAYGTAAQVNEMPIAW